MLRLLVTAFCLILAPVLAGAADDATGSPAPRIPLWSRFEASADNPSRFTDPFRDVSLDVTYTAPDGRKIGFWGFYDGGTTWRIRFMPDMVGTWRYDAVFTETTATDPSGAATETRSRPAISGAFECVPSDLPGQIVVHSENPQWFGWRDREAMLIRALHVGDRFFARNWEPARRLAFLDWAQGQGYNTLSIASFFLNRRAHGRGEGWDNPELWPLDPEEFRQMEGILDELAARRIIVYPFAGFFGRDAHFPGNHADQTRYIRYVLARLGPSWNLLWNVGGPEPLLRRRPYLTFAEVDRLGAQIARLDPFRHPISVHNASGDDAFKDQPWLTYGTLQGPKTFDRARLRDGLLRNHHLKKPLLAQETLWSGNSVHIRANQGVDYSDDDLRKNAYVIHFSAAYLVFADNQGDSSTGFTGTMDPADLRQARHDIVKLVWDTVETLPWQRTTPRPDLISNVVGTGNAFCLADPGRTYLVYLDAPGTVSVQTTGGPYQTEWINARQPSDRRRGGLTQDGANLTSPQDGDDWILILNKPDATALP